MNKLKGNETGMDVILKLAEGNPGCIHALLEMLKYGDAIDPDSALKGVLKLMIFDTWGIYGSSIYVLWNDKCGRDVRELIMLLRATQLGIFSHDYLQRMAADQNREVNISQEDMDTLNHDVMASLPNFMSREDWLKVKEVKVGNSQYDSRDGRKTSGS